MTAGSSKTNQTRTGCILDLLPQPPGAVQLKLPLFGSYPRPRITSILRGTWGKASKISVDMDALRGENGATARGQIAP